MAQIQQIEPLEHKMVAPSPIASGEGAPALG